MTYDDYLAGEYTDDELDRFADAGDYFLDEEGYNDIPSDEELRELFNRPWNKRQWINGEWI